MPETTDQHCRECRVLRPETCTCLDLFAASGRVDEVAIPILRSALGDAWSWEQRG